MPPTHAPSAEEIQAYYRAAVPHQAVRAALHDCLRILDHDPVEPIADYIKSRALECEVYLRGPVAGSDPSFLVKRIQDLFRLLNDGRHIPTHPNVPAIKKISDATRWMAEHAPSTPRWKGWEEYGDVFTLLSETLRCRLCFSGFHFNKDNARTSREFDWETIAHALLEDPDVVLPPSVPKSSIFLRSAALPEDRPKLARSIRTVCLVLDWDYNAIAWQIIKYNIYLEVHEGPKWSLRNGRWGLLAQHLNRTTRNLRAFRESSGVQIAERRRAVQFIETAVRCTGIHWFGEPGAKYTPSLNAIELSRRLAESGEPRLDTSRRSEPLYDIRKFTQELLSGSCLIGNNDRTGTATAAGALASSDNDAGDSVQG